MSELKKCRPRGRGSWWDNTRNYPSRPPVMCQSMFTSASFLSFSQIVSQTRIPLVVYTILKAKNWCFLYCTESGNEYREYHWSTIEVALSTYGNSQSLSEDSISGSEWSILFSHITLLLSSSILWLVYHRSEEQSHSYTSHDSSYNILSRWSIS